MARAVLFGIAMYTSESFAASSLVPRMQHPIVELIMNRAHRDGSERFVVDEEMRALLEDTLLAHGDDPTLPNAVYGLFGLACLLWEEERSQSAAVAIITAVGHVAPQLAALRESDGSFAESLSDAARKADALRVLAPPA